MRVTGGRLVSRRIRSLKGKLIRPTSDRVRESLFAILAQSFVGRDFLDLFAGTGAVGIEALSRGARRAMFIEEHGPAVHQILENLKALDLAESAKVIRGRLPEVLGRLDRYNLDPGVIFIDPPYTQPPNAEFFQALDRMSCLVSGTVIVVEHEVKKDLEHTIKRIVQTDFRNYGDTALSIFEVQS